MGVGPLVLPVRLQRVFNCLLYIRSERAPRILFRFLYLYEREEVFCHKSPSFRENSASEFIVDVPDALLVQELHEFGISHEGADIAHPDRLQDLGVLKDLLHVGIILKGADSSHDFSVAEHLTSQ
jgi:hypothetical protein